jgi:hypothetical protein
MELSMKLCLFIIMINMMAMILVREPLCKYF